MFQCWLKNYFVWCLKTKASVSLKRLNLVISEVKAKGLNENYSKEWDKKKLWRFSLVHKVIPVWWTGTSMWKYSGRKYLYWTSTWRIKGMDARSELKNFGNKIEWINKGLYCQCLGNIHKMQNPLGLNVSECELMFYTLWELKDEFSRLNMIRV